MGASAQSQFSAMRDHHATEAMLRDSGVAWTALRNGFYAESAFQLMGGVLTTRQVRAPADGKVSWTTHADLAEAAAIIVTRQLYDGPTPALTGPAALDLADLAAIAGQCLGAPVEREVISDAAFIEGVAARGVPEGVGAMMLGLFKACRAGEFALVDPTLAAMLGRTPASVETLIAQAVAGR